MEIGKGELIFIVKSARTSLKIAEDIKNILRVEKAWTAMDDVAGWMVDVLFDLSGEILRFDQDFQRDSKVLKLLRSDLTDGEVAAELEWMNTINKEVEEDDPG